jgi:peptide deformylase
MELKKERLLRDNIFRYSLGVQEEIMSIKPVIKMGNQKLATVSLPVKNFSDGELKELIIDMQDTMKEKGGVGIAAPQIGCNLRVIMFGFEHNARYPNEKPVPFTVLINPIITVLDEEMVDGWEGCLSVPGLRGFIPRYNKISYAGFDINRNQISRTVDGFHARILQHECDHLDGVLFPHRLKSMKYFGFEDELKDIIWPHS